MSNKRDKTPNQEKFKPSGKLAQQQHNIDKEFQQIVQGMEQLGEPVEERIINRSKVLQADSQSTQSRAKSGEKKKFKVNPNLKKSIDPELIKQQQKEEQEALQKMQVEQEYKDETNVATQKVVTSLFILEKAQKVETKQKPYQDNRIIKEEIGDSQMKDYGATEVQITDNNRPIVEGTIEIEEIADTHKPENMFEPTKLPFVLGGGAQSSEIKKDGKIHHDILDPSKLNLLQFPSQFAYKLPQNQKTKLKLKRLDIEKLHDHKEILSYNAQKSYDSAGNSIKYNYSTIDYFGQRDPKKEQSFNMGKLRFYSDGSVQLISGQNLFDVTEGVQNQYQNMHLAETPTMFNIDNINKKFVIQPNIDELYKK